MKPNSSIGFMFRLLAARLWLRLSGRRNEIMRLFAGTAEAFGCTVPPSKAHGVKDLLTEYALFTKNHADLALNDSKNSEALEHRLFETAHMLGTRYRFLLGVHNFRDAMAAARLIYGELGIEFFGGPDGEVKICRCAFAEVYTSRVCFFISALDKGLLAGLTNGGVLTFRRRMTEGATACRAHIIGGMS